MVSKIFGGGVDDVRFASAHASGRQGQLTPILERFQQPSRSKSPLLHLVVTVGQEEGHGGRGSLQAGLGLPTPIREGRGDRRREDHGYLCDPPCGSHVRAQVLQDACAQISNFAGRTSHLR